jgi:ketosteroid isomerase-like protein
MEGVSMTRLAVMVLCLAGIGCGTDAQHPKLPQKNQAAIQVVLDDQVSCWNNGDLEGFMRGYWNSDELEFKSSDKITNGWQATFDRYKKKYQSDGAEMGTLKFSNLVIADKSPEAIVTGDWHLTMKDGKTPHGSFNLKLELKPDGWKIVRDETTSAE